MKRVTNCIISAMFLAGIALCSHAQEYVSPTQPVEKGKASGVKVKLLSDNGHLNYL